MKILAIDYWDARQTKLAFLNRLRTETFDKIFIFTQNEFEFDKIFEEYLYPFLGYYIETKKLNVDLITGVIPELNTSQPFGGLNIHHWDMYWLSKTYSILYDFKLVQERANQQITSNKIKYPFIMLNNRSHSFRAQLMDYVAEAGLVDKGAISWNNTDTFLMKEFTFKYFDGKDRILDEKYKTPAGGQYSLPDQYFESVAQLISESNPDIIFFSEKISTALLLEKPFLAAAGPGIHQYLNKRMGIKYYDDIFNYDFDSEPDMDKRWKMIVENFVKLSKHPINILEEIHSQLQEKALYNKNRAIEIVHDLNFMPKPIQEYFYYYKTTEDKINNDLCRIMDSINLK